MKRKKIQLLAVVVTKIANTVNKRERMIATVGFFLLRWKDRLHEQPCAEQRLFVARFDTPFSLSNEARELTHKNFFQEN